MVSTKSLLLAKSTAGAISEEEKRSQLIHHLLRQDENYLVSHILGLAALSLLKVSNTIGNDNIVKVCLYLDIFHHPLSFSGL